MAESHRCEPKLTAKPIKTVKSGELITIDGMKGLWGRLRVDIATDTHTKTSWLLDDESASWWVLTWHSEHGTLLRLLKDDSILLP
eukprot:771850-Prorocentrum_minimum.AAC.1